MAGEPLELEVALRAQRIAREELCETMDLSGPECHVDEREALEDLLLDRLGPAASDADEAPGAFPLQPLRLAEVGDEAAVRRLPDRARVEQDQVRILPGGRLAVAERLEHALHPLGVMLVHLAPEGGEVVLRLHTDGLSRGGAFPPDGA